MRTAEVYQGVGEEDTLCKFAFVIRCHGALGYFTQCKDVYSPLWSLLSLSPAGLSLPPQNSPAV